MRKKVVEWEGGENDYLQRNWKWKEVGVVGVGDLN